MITIYDRNGGFIIDLHIETLRGANLQDANLQGADLQGANLQGADLQGADLEGADLQGANLQGADLQGADLQGADLQGADLEGADLEGADLQYANIHGANLQGAATVVYGLRWTVYVTKGNVRIGCQTHSLDKWESFTDEDIKGMSPQALEFWGEHKDYILTLCRKLTRR